MRRCLSDLIKHKKRLVEDVDFEIGKIRVEVKESIERYFHSKYLSYIKGATCIFTIRGDLNNVSEDAEIVVYYNNKWVSMFYLKQNYSDNVEHVPFAMQKFIQNMHNKEKFEKMKTNMIRIYEKYTWTPYLQNLSKTITLTLCNQHRRIFPKDILNIIIKKLFLNKKQKIIINLIFFTISICSSPRSCRELPSQRSQCFQEQALLCLW